MPVPRVTSVRLLWSLLAALLLWAPPIQGQTASEADLTAAFLFNFAKFTDWPSDALAPDAPLNLCAADEAVAGALDTAVVGHVVGAHAVKVMRVSVDPVPRDCAVLYVSGLDARRTTRLLNGLGDTSVLSVGDSEDFITLGGVVRLFVEDGQMRFAVNVNAAERARLRLSSQLLSLARIVRPQP
jgi:hypothetical protein